ncbi:hypothetical protein BC834DRAFT_529592 [Gloeopeniophorella convolvens]|nr:hypothetical protein BC834DRAFT_529592 [Gloeopeniophorella convolvens]
MGSSRWMWMWRGAGGRAGRRGATRAGRCRRTCCRTRARRPRSASWGRREGRGGGPARRIRWRAARQHQQRTGVSTQAPGQSHPHRITHLLTLLHRPYRPYHPPSIIRHPTDSWPSFQFQSTFLFLCLFASLCLLACLLARSPPFIYSVLVCRMSPVCACACRAAAAPIIT